MKKIVLLSFFGFGFVMADEAGVDGALVANGQVNCGDSSAEDFNGFYAGVGAGVGRVKHEVWLEKALKNGVVVNADTKTIDKGKTVCDGELSVGYGRFYKVVYLGIEGKCGLGGKYKVDDDDGTGREFEKSVKACRPSVFAKIGGLLPGGVLAYGKMGVLFTKAEWSNVGANAFSRDCTSGQFSIGCGAEKQVSKIGSRRIFGRIEGEYAFGKRKYVNGANGEAFSGKMSRGMVSVSAVIR